MKPVKARFSGICLDPLTLLTCVLGLALLFTVESILTAGSASRHSDTACIDTASEDTNRPSTALMPLAAQLPFRQETRVFENGFALHNPFADYYDHSAGEQDRSDRSVKHNTNGSIDDHYESEWKTVRMKVTAYCPCAICCGKNADGITASMHKIRWGDRFVAADKKFGFGTEFIIPGYNNGKPVSCEDRGRLIKGNSLDVFFNTHYSAKKWGVRYIDVKVRVR